MHAKHKNKSQEYLNGFDAGKNGSDTSNGNYANFSNEQGKKDWEAGFKNGQRQKKWQENKPFLIGGVPYEAIVVSYRPLLSDYDE